MVPSDKQGMWLGQAIKFKQVLGLNSLQLGLVVI